MIGNVEGLDALEHLVPISVIVPIEARIAGARDTADFVAEVPEAVDHTTAGFAAAAYYEERSGSGIYTLGGLRYGFCFHRS